MSYPIDEPIKIYKSKLNLYKLKKVKSNFQKTQINNSTIANMVVKPFFDDDIEIYESFFILFMNRANDTIGYAKLSQGGITSTTFDVRLVAKYCIESLATQIILAHNHPTGCLEASTEDKNLTKKTIDVLKIFDIQVIDHLILTKDSYTSFADDNIMKLK